MDALPKLIADAMLGKLARWLRLLGYDTLYLQEEDAVIAQRARSEGRTLLTRDQELADRRGLQTIHITAQTLEAQLNQVLEEVGPLPSGTPSRCMACNAPLEPISSAEARPHVPPYIAQTHDEFHRCPNCGKITWPGTHWAGIQERLKQVE